ncbi:MAG: hypothetical protein JNM76_14925 [Betaproteobacteria bacterium]|nr:hypothetical protein [Betaproteobacteria bacterium]
MSRMTSRVFQDFPHCVSNLTGNDMKFLNPFRGRKQYYNVVAIRYANGRKSRPEPGGILSQRLQPFWFTIRAFFEPVALSATTSFAPSCLHRLLIEWRHSGAARMEILCKSFSLASWCALRWLVLAR